MMHTGGHDDKEHLYYVHSAHTCMREVPTRLHKQQRQTQTENNGAFRQQATENGGKTQLEHP